ncbi:MAG: cpdA [Rhodocyclaceae bacterium]|nr:cpdA [Rhodocyclaceae bacterium]
MRIAQLSDLHLTADAQPLYGVVDTEGACRAALSRARSMEPVPDLLLLTGDLANDGAAPAYDRLKAALADLQLPYALLPGNHDSRPELRAAFADHAWAGEPLCCLRQDWAEGSLLLLDTTVPGKEWGEIGDAQLNWLQAACPADRPVLLCLHHPPFDIGVPGMDAIRCRNEDRLLAWLGSRPNVEALLCGHVHRLVATTFAGRPALTAPSTAHQIALKPGPLAYTLEAGGFLWHDWQPGRRLLTHYVPAQPAPVHVYED